MLIGFSGLAGSGKDSAADTLLKGPGGGWVRCALADPLKRMAQHIYDFSDEQLWGPSQERNRPDARYPRPDHTWSSRGDQICACCGAARADGVDCHLTPRYVLQRMGTEMGRRCWPDTWVTYALRVFRTLQRGDHLYDQKAGLTRALDGQEPLIATNMVVPDIRFWNEIEAVKAAGGFVVRVRRPGYDVPAWLHASETEQMQVEDVVFDYLLDNHGTLEDLAGQVTDMYQEFVRRSAFR